MKQVRVFKERSVAPSWHPPVAVGRDSLGLFVLMIAGLLAAAPMAAQNFKNPRMISTSSDPSTISQGDFNGDGKTDLAYLDGGAPRGLHILLGNGDGTFQHGQDIQLPSGIGGAITVADVNKDGKPDIVLGGGGPQGQIGVLLGQGDGTFQAPIVSQFPAGGPSYAEINSVIGVADFNGDGAADLAAADVQDNVVYILLGNNTGSFTLKATLPSGTASTTVFTGDFNGDGHQDFIVQSVLGAGVTVFLGKGDGTFQSGVGYTGPHNITSMLLADMDGDGHLDLVVSGFGNTIDILHGNSDGTFATSSEGGSSYGGPGATLLAIADFNADGILDIATASDNGISILLGKGDLSYAFPVPYSGSPTPNSAVMADFNADGYKDFAEIAPGGIALTFGAAGGTLQSADLYDLGQGQQLNAVAIADFNGDRLQDIAVDAARPTPIILLGKGGGKFSIPVIGPATATIPATFIATGDFNGDGKTDLLLTGSSSLGTVLFGNGNGTFGAPAMLSTPSNPGIGVVALGDFNHDGTTDIASLDYEELDVLLGQKNETFTVKPSSYFFLASSNGSAAADFNGDGKLDLVVTQDEANTLQILIGNGDGTFQLGRQLAAASLPQAIVVGDFDGDGKVDIAACFGFQNLLQIFYGNGDGTFQGAVNIPLQRGYTQMAVADMDGDGKPDLIFSDGSVISIIPNTGNRTFGPEEHFLAGVIAGFAVKDVSGDGLPDIVVANGNSGNGSSPTTVTVLINQGSAPTISGQLTVTPEPASYGQPFTISLAIAAEGAGVPAPTGSVAISIDDTPIATIPVTGLNLSYADANHPSLPTGAHTIVATYSGDAHFLAGTFTLPLHIVPNIYPTTTTLVGTPTTVLAGQTVRFAAAVSSPDANVNYPNGIVGTVVFRDGTTNLGASTLNSGGVAIFDTALLSMGMHGVTASYLGYTAVGQQTGSFAPSSSTDLSVTVNANPTSTNLTALSSSTQTGSIVSLTAIVTSSKGTPEGAVTFFDGTLPLSAQPLDGTGTAVSNVTFASAGTHTLTASYQANGNFGASTSSPFSVTVSSAAQANRSSTLLTATQSSQLVDGITLMATVTSQRSAPTGNIVFMDGAARLGEASLNSRGVATYSTQLTAPGLHYLRALFSGNSQLGPSVSPALLEQAPLNSPDFSLSLSTASITVRQGRTASIAATVSPINGFKTAVTLSCGSEMPNMSCSFEPGSAPDGLGTSVMVINTAQRLASFSFRPPKQIASRRALLGAALFCFIVLLMLRPPRRRLSLSFACFLLAASAIGCGAPVGSTAEALTPAGRYVITVTATAQKTSAPVTHSVPVQIMVSTR